MIPMIKKVFLKHGYHTSERVQLLDNTMPFAGFDTATTLYLEKVVALKSTKKDSDEPIKTPDDAARVFGVLVMPKN